MDLSEGLGYEVGGEWTAEWRRLHVESGGWLRGGDIPTYLYAVRLKALEADARPSPGSLEALRHACSKLQVAIERHQHRLDQLLDKAGYMTAAVLRARDEADDPVDADEMTRQLIADTDAWVNEAAKVYGLERHLHRSRDE